MSSHNGNRIVDTKMWANIDEVFGAEQGLKAGEHMDDRRKEILLGRVSVPDDVAKLVSFLVSDDAEYITGDFPNCFLVTSRRSSPALVTLQAKR